MALITALEIRMESLTAHFCSKFAFHHLALVKLL